MARYRRRGCLERQAGVSPLSSFSRLLDQRQSIPTISMLVTKPVETSSLGKDKEGQRARIMFDYGLTTWQLLSLMGVSCM